MPSTSDFTSVNSRFSWACSTCASAALTAAFAAWFACMSLSNWLCAMARSLASGVSRFDIHLGFAELCLSLGQLGIRLVEEGLERAWIDLKKNLPLADERTFFVRLPNDVSCHLGLNLRVDIAVERGNPFAVNRNIFLNHAGDFHFGIRNG